MSDLKEWNQGSYVSKTTDSAYNGLLEGRLELNPIDSRRVLDERGESNQLYGLAICLGEVEDGLSSAFNG